MRTAPLVAVALVSAVAMVAGVVGLIRDGRRIGALVLAMAGLGGVAVSIALLLFVEGRPGMLVVIGISALLALVVGNLIGYPLLTSFLLFSGITVLRRESRTLGNALALIAGVGLLVLPGTLSLLTPPETVQDDVGYMVRYAVHLTVVLIVAYVAISFAAFIAASLLYRWRGNRVRPEAIIVLGSGLVDGRVPPLLAGRLDRGLRVQRDHGGGPVIIASGGQGADEPRPEGTAMREYLIEQGADPERVLAETRSVNTSQNLRYSQALLTRPDAPVVVVTSSYHVFRAALLTRSLGLRAHTVGARTAWYYLPSAVLREFAGVMRDHLRLHLLSIVLLTILAVVVTVVLVPAMVPPPD